MCKQTLHIRQQHLTQREAEILLDCSLCLSITQTAEKLFISPATVKRHRENLRDRFGLTKQGYQALFRFALEIKQELEEFLEKCEKV